MIRVTIEMLPGGSELRRQRLHVIEIWNDLEDTRKNRRFGSYRYRISRKINPETDRVTWHKEGRITRFPRAAKNSVHLLLAVLKDAYWKERTDG